AAGSGTSCVSMSPVCPEARGAGDPRPRLASWATMTGRSVVVTAAASGIGFAIAKAFAAAGDRVHICDIDETALAKVTESIPGVTTTVCDISDRAAVEAFIAEATTTLGGIDILINNA